MKFIKKQLIFHSILLLLIFCCVTFSKQRLNVLVVLPRFPKIHDICMLNQITGLLAKGHRVIIKASELGDTKNLQKDVIKYQLLSKTIIGNDFPRNLNDYDIVVFQLGHKAVNIKKTHNFKGKVVICLRGYDITGFIKENPHAYDEFFETCDLFMPVCEVFKTTLQKLGCNPNKIIVHHSGIDCNRFAFKRRTIPKTGTINILSAGRYVEKKGFIYSILAVAHLIKKYPRIRYTIIGDGELKQRYTRLINKLGMKNKIKLANWYTHEEYIKVLDRSHIFIVPSVTAKDNDQEGIPNVLKEAMAMGLFVIGTNHSGNSELIQDNVSGFLIPERSVGAIESIVEFILHNSERLFAMQRAARFIVEKEFDTKKVNDMLENIFLNLVNYSHIQR